MIKRWMTTCYLFLLAACTTRPAALPRPRDVLPASDSILRWHRVGESATYDRESLPKLLGDQADLYLSYGFKELAVDHYTNADGSSVQIEVY